MRGDRQRGRTRQAPAQAPRVADLDKARAQRKKQKLRSLLVWVLPLALILVCLIAGNSAALVSAGDVVETLRISTMRGQGWPQSTGISQLYQWEEMDGGFVALGQENAVFYTNKGVRLRAIQAGYARPALSAGNTRFVLYNRGGTELRVESRSKNLYTQQYPGGILLCEMGPDGSLAVVTEDPSYTAQMLVYPSNMEQPLTWKLTSKEGTPIAMAFSDNEKKLAVATLSAAEGKTVSRLYILDRTKQKEIQLDTRTGAVPLQVEWRGDTLLVAYSDGVAAYQEKKGLVASYDLQGRTLVDLSILPNGRMALLENHGSTAHIVLLDKNLTETGRIPVEAGNGVVLTRTGIYLYTDANVICYTREGEYAWHIPCDMHPQGLLRTDAGVLLFRGGEVLLCTDPDPES